MITIDVKNYPVFFLQKAQVSRLSSKALIVSQKVNKMTAGVMDPRKDRLGEGMLSKKFITRIFEKENQFLSTIDQKLGVHKDDIQNG